MAYGLILTGGTPDSVSSMRQFIDKVSQNFRKLEQTLTGGGGETGDPVVVNIAYDASGYRHVMTFIYGILTSYIVTSVQPAGVTKSLSFTDADGNVHTVNIMTGIITSWDITAP
ncbi:MAG: hypothetical protein V1755_06705 [Chloroflexota bacterium]